jgi:hypothetical protein
MIKNKSTELSSSFIIFKTEDESVSVDVRFEDETVWLTQDQMVLLFAKDERTISAHIRNVFKEGESEENSVVRKFRITAADGKNYDTELVDFGCIAFSCTS